MRKLLPFIVVLLSACAWAQYTSVTATVKDSVNALYANGSFDIVFIPNPAGTTLAMINGAVVSPREVVGQIDSFGALAVTLTDNSLVTPSGSQWRFRICAQDKVTCFATSLTISGASQNITSSLQSAAPLVPGTGSILSTTNVFTGSSNTFNGTVIIPEKSKGFLNLVTDCGLVADGVTDDYAALATCLTAHPGAHFIVPKVCVTGAATYDCVDILLSQSITLGPNQWLDGETAHFTNNRGTGEPVIKWSVDTTGIIIPVSAVGAHISNLALKSSLWPSGRWSDSDLTTWPQNSSSDGIYVGATAVIENVDIDGFSRHGINVDGSQNGQQPDLWKVRNVRAGSLGGDGLFLHGGDANAGFSEGMSVYTSNGWGIRDNGNLGNTHLQPHTNGNHRNAGVAAGSTVNISTIAVAANVVSVTTATNHSFSVGSWITVAGTTNFNGTVKVITVPTSTSFTYNFVSSAASEATGTVKKESGLNVYANAQRTVQKCSISSGTASLSCSDANFYDDHQPGAAITVAGAGAAGGNLVTTIVSVNNGYNAVLTANASTTVSNVWATVGGGWGGGPYNASQPSTTVTWINMYQEGNQPVSKLASGSIVVGNNSIGNFDFTYGKPLILQAGSTGEIDAPAGVFRFKNNTDALFNVILQSGVAAAQETDLIFYDHNGAAMHSIRANFGGGASGQLDFRDDRIGNIWLAGGGSTNAGTFLRANGSGALDLMSTGTGNMTVFGGSGSNGTTFTNAGATTFSKQIISSLATGTAPLSVASTTTVPNLTASNHPKVQFCGTTSTCSATAEVTDQVVYGSAPLVSGTPSTVTVTGISPAFTSSSSYVCVVTDATTATNNLLKVANVSGSSFTITGPNTLSDTINYQCAGH